MAQDRDQPDRQVPDAATWLPRADAPPPAADALPARVRGVAPDAAEAGPPSLPAAPALAARLGRVPGASMRALRDDPRWGWGIVLGLLVLMAIFAPLVAPYPPLLYHPQIIAQPPSLAHLLGTDSLGRDELSRVIYGARISLSVGIGAIVIGGAIGTLLGLIAGYARGWVDQGVTMIADALLSFPPLLLPLAIAAVLGPSILNVVIALAVARVPIYARLARGQALQVRGLDYVLAARTAGTGTWGIVWHHVLPNIFSPLLVQGTISVSLAILDESVLSFLGLGAQPPTPEWGAMISEAQPYLTGGDPWMLLGPSLAIVLTVLSINILGDALRDRMDPRRA